MLNFYCGYFQNVYASFWIDKSLGKLLISIMYVLYVNRTCR